MLLEPGYIPASIMADFWMFSGSQCFCGNSIANTAALAGDCLMPCPGNSTEMCGGSNRLTLWIYE